MCGVFGIRSVERDVARLSYFALFALQHRGQESAGIAVSDGGRLTVLRDMGLVAQVFNEQQLQALPGEVAIGHTRYSTTGGVHWSNAQPLVHHGRARTVALGHNGNLTNAGALREELVADGIRLGSTSDTEVIAALIARDPAPAARGGGGHDAPSRGRLLGRRARRRHPRHLPRPARHPAAHARPHRRRLGRRLRELRARPDRRRRRPRRAPRRGALAGRRRDPQRAGAARGTRRGVHLRARVLRPSRLAARRQRDPREPGAHGAAARRGGARRRRPRDADPRLRHAGGDRVRQGLRASPTTRG